MNITFWIIYVVFGFLAQLIALSDMKRNVAIKMVSDPTIMIHEDHLQTGERITFPATELDDDSEIINEVVQEQLVNRMFTPNNKIEVIKFIGTAFFGFVLWPIAIPIGLRYIHKHIDSFVEFTVHPE